MEHYHSIIGLPFSGKTTFLAALWHLIEAGEVRSLIELDRLEGNHSYLNQIADAWRNCKPVPRTSMLAEADVRIHAKLVGTGQQIVLGFPDLSGESFERQFTNRTVRRDYVDGVNRAGGIMLFVSANKGIEALTHADLGPDLLGAEAATPIDGDASAQPQQPVDWAHDMVSQQAVLVDLLQTLQRPPFERRKRRTLIVISAWDVVTDTGIEPEEWLTREMPFLAQYLNHNPDSFEVRICGISAQGGDIEGPAREALLKMSTASERIRCVGLGDNAHDLTASIAWLSGAISSEQ